MTDEQLILNRNTGMDVLHRSAGLTEMCNSDDVVDRSKVDARTAAAMIAAGEARPCQHCMPLADEAHI
jgi:hypothetical protein